MENPAHHHHWRIISGGQTGVDQGALDAALDCGVDCGGACPSGRIAENGSIPPKYPVVEIAGGYEERNLKNVRDAKATIILYSDTLEDGTLLTRDYCVQESTLWLNINAAITSHTQAAELIGMFIALHQCYFLNIAGPRKSKWPDAHQYSYNTIKLLLENHKISK